MVSFNGFFACGFCLHPGKSIKNPSGSSTVRYLWLDERPLPRETSETVNTMVNMTGGQIKCGIKGVSPLLGLKEFDIVNSMAIDYLHSVLKGVVEKLLDLWLNAKFHKKEFYLRPKQQHALDLRISKIKASCEITRKPVSAKNVSKANEVRTLLLYFLPVAMKGLQKKCTPIILMYYLHPCTHCSRHK